MCPLQVIAQDAGAPDFARLAEDLTPVGAERAGNADGSIPEWTGGLTQPPADWDPEQGYVNPYADETPILEITAANLQAHRGRLTPGLIALLEQRHGFSMRVFPTHRSFAWPEPVYAAIRKHAGRAQVVDKKLVGHLQPGIPFPIPATAEQVMFNHLNRWIGGVESCSDWFPIRGNGDHYRVGWCQKVIQASQMDRVEDDGDGTYFRGRYDAPSTLIGTIYLVHEGMDGSASARRAWIYNAGMRRVRRAPDLAYDNTADGTEGMATIDDAGGFNGALDRYDWSLLGKREIYVPYNAYALSDSSLRYEDMIVGNLIDPALMRYELHRVWVVEANLSDGMSHVYKRRRFYLDEDSWQVVIAENYDSRDELWRVSLLPTLQLYDVPTMIARSQMNHDLSSGSLLASGFDNERRQPAMKWNVKGHLAEFRPSALR